MDKIKGLIVAPFTGFTASGAVDSAKVSEQYKFYRDNGIRGVFVCGTTGEGSSLTFEEKKLLFKEWSKFSSKDFLVIGFLGATSVPEAIALSKYAYECGLGAVSMTAPYYQKAADVHELALTLGEVASAVPELPFFYYHIPCLTNVNFSMYSLLKEVDGLIPNFAGIKYTFENLFDYQMCLEYKDRKYNIMWGRDEMLLPALSVGATAFVGSTYGYNAPVYHEIIKAYEALDLERAAELQYEANLIIDVLCRYGNGAGKAFMKAAGMDLGPCRRPLTTFTDERYSQMLSELEDTEFDKYKCVKK